MCGREAAAIAVDEDRGQRRTPHLHLATAQIARNVILERRDRDARHVPEPGQTPREHVGSGKRALVVSSCHDQGDSRPTEWRRHGGNQALPFRQFLKIDRPARCEPLDDCVVAADQNGQRTCWRLLTISPDERHRQRRRLEPETRGDVAGTLNLAHRRRRWHDDPRGDHVCQTVAVSVSDDAGVQAPDRGEASRSFHLVGSRERPPATRYRSARWQAVHRRTYGQASCRAASAVAGCRGTEQAPFRAVASQNNAEMRVNLGSARASATNRCNGLL